MRGRKIWLLTICIVAGLFWVWKGLINDFDSLDTLPLSPTIAITRLFKDVCHYLEDDLVGDEADMTLLSQFEHVGLVLAFRHGDRFTVYQPMGERKTMAGHESDCTAFNDIDRRSFSFYQRLVESPSHNAFFDFNQMFKEFSRIPDRSKCDFGKLTAEGALQLLKLGNFLRYKYEHTGIFKGLKTSEIFFISTNYERTFQSAIAFASAFLYPNRENIVGAKISLKASTYTYAAWRDVTICPLAQKYRDTFEDLRLKTFNEDAPASLRKNLLEFAEIVDLDKYSTPIDVVDVLLGRYACRRQSLPCHTVTGRCISHIDFKQSLDEALRLDTVILAGTSDVRRLFVAEAYPILYDLLLLMRSLRKNQQLLNGDIINNGKNKLELHYAEKEEEPLRIYSGHDVMLWPLVFVLFRRNVGEMLPYMPYASRIAFELYERKEKMSDGDDESFFIRVLLNGVDRTASLKFCEFSAAYERRNRPPVLCKARDFENFVERGIFESVGVKSHRELCT